MEKCDEKVLWLDYKNITKVVQNGSYIYVDDGLISLKVKEIGKRTAIICLAPCLMQILLSPFCLLMEIKFLFILCPKATTS